MDINLWYAHSLCSLQYYIRVLLFTSTMLAYDPYEVETRSKIPIFYYYFFFTGVNNSNHLLVCQNMQENNNLRAALSTTNIIEVKVDKAIVHCLF